MEQYKEKLKVNYRITLWCTLLFVAVSILGILAQGGIIPLTPAAGDGHWHAKWRGFLTGGASGGAGALVVGLVRMRRALKDEKELKKLYIRDNDERQIQIWTSARASAMQAFLMLGMVAVIVSGYFSIPVSLTILACVLVNTLLGLGFKVYYSRKY